jgi:hypothetical protein
VGFIDGQRLDGEPRILISDSFHRFRAAPGQPVYGGSVNWPLPRRSLGSKKQQEVHERSRFKCTTMCNLQIGPARCSSDGVAL